MYLPIFSMYHNKTNNTMGITTPMGLISDEYPIGEGVLSYLNCDLSNYNKIYKAYRIYRDSLLMETRKKRQQEAETIFFNSCKKIYTEYKKQIKHHDKELDDPLSAKTMDDIEKNYYYKNFFHTALRITTEPHLFTRCSEMPFSNDLDLKNFQNILNEMVMFCFDKDYSDHLNTLTPLERYYLWQIRQKDGINKSGMAIAEMFELAIESSNTLLPQNMLDIDMRDFIRDNEINEKTINLIKSSNVFQIQLYHCKTPSEFALCEFHAMLETGMYIKKCPFCGKYFILHGNYHKKYCSDCKAQAISTNYRNKVKSSPILKEYNKAYQRNNARVKSGSMTKEEFRLWTDAATKKRDELFTEYQNTPSEELLSYFKKYLDNK